MRVATSLYSQTPRQFSRERADCAVRALRVACDLSYETAHAALSRAGRIDGRGTYNRTLQMAECTLRRDAYNVTFTHVMPPAGGPITWPTLAQFVRSHQTGRFVIRVKGHFIALVDGVVHDWTRKKTGARSRVRRAWHVSLGWET